MSSLHQTFSDYVASLAWPAAAPAQKREPWKWVNGRGQLLTIGPEPRQTSNLPDKLGLWDYDRTPAGDALLAEMKADTLLCQRARCLQNDGGAAFIQQMDFDAAALRTYLLTPFLEEYDRRRTSSGLDVPAFDALYAQVFDALLGPRAKRSIVTPVLGLRMTRAIQLEGEVCVRAATEDEQTAWSRDGSLDGSLLRDLLKCEAVVEVQYSAGWPERETADAPLNVSTFDADGADAAVALVQACVGALRVVTGRTLPLLFSEEAVVALPWVTSRFFHVPFMEDMRRRYQRSPLWVWLVDAEPLTVGEETKLAQLWTAVRDRPRPHVDRALRLFTRDRDYVNLYRIFEVLESSGAPLNKWSSKKERGVFTRTANSIEAVGEAWARHGTDVSAPTRAITWKEADELVRRLLLGVALDQ